MSSDVDERGEDERCRPRETHLCKESAVIVDQHERIKERRHPHQFERDSGPKLDVGDVLRRVATAADGAR